jgi:hypothetical protein
MRRLPNFGPALCGPTALRTATAPGGIGLANMVDSGGRIIILFSSNFSGVPESHPPVLAPTPSSIVSGIEAVRFSQLPALSDCVSVHAPPTMQTRGLPNAFRKMKKSAPLARIRCLDRRSTSRAKALDSGPVCSVALDAVATEPVASDLFRRILTIPPSSRRRAQAPPPSSTTTHRTRGRSWRR